MILVITLLVGACGHLGNTLSIQPQEADQGAPYSWSSFFNDECGKRMQVRLKNRNKGVLAYGCAGGDRQQELRRHQDKGKIQFWVADRLADDELYQLSNAKCQAAIVVLGSDYATIHFRCAVVQLTVAYAVMKGRAMEDPAADLWLEPRQALVTYGDGTQQFDVREDMLVPAEPFKPFQTGSEPALSL